MTTDEALTGIHIKLERAESHLNELEISCKNFLVTRPYVIRCRKDEQTLTRTYYIASAADVPGEIAAIAGDVLQNLRSALDHLAYQLFESGTGRKGNDGKHVYFPIFDSASGCAAGLTLKVKGMQRNAVDAIEALKPYRGGDDILWRLQQLNNRDKHRLLVTVAGINRFASMTPSQRAEMTRRFYGSYPADHPAPNLIGTMMPVPQLRFPLKVGDDLLTISESDVEESMSFHFDIAFAESGVAEGDSAVQTLRDMRSRVGQIVTELGALIS